MRKTPTTPATESTQKPWRFHRRWRGLWLGFLAAFIPLVLLLVLQYRWLGELESKSTIAWQAHFNNYLTTVTKEVEYSYRKEAEKALNLPAVVFEPEYAQKAAKYFKKRSPSGFRRLFVISYLEPRFGRMRIYDAEAQALVDSSFTEEVRAIYVAAAPWSMVAKKGGVVDTTAVAVDIRDPSHRILLNPITNETEKLVGLAGAVIDQEYFASEILPKAVQQAIPTLESTKNLSVVVRDAEGEAVSSIQKAATSGGRVPPLAKPSSDAIYRSLSFVFADWRIGLEGSFSRPEKLARANFALNVTLSTILGLLLLGGILTVLRTTAKEMKLSEMKNDFVSNVSHELRTPLSSIRVFGEFLRLGRASTEEKVREYGEYIETESRRLTQLINNILDFSRIESGHRSYQFESTNLVTIISEALDTFEVRLRHSGFLIDWDPPENPPPNLQLDAGAIRQALCNLLDNAVKYSNGGRRIGVRLIERKGWLVLEVEDEGIGISRQEQKRIFERFHRVGTGLVHDVKGAGLGLSIVNHVIQAHGGKVEVDSTLGKGSVFSLHLPTESEDPPIESQDAPVYRDHPSQGAKS
ncbi:MAG: HAMP domain-containing histidine kinase [Deltaproteobacteria bacterium]|nr:HAMP domain-containing histidine kinase [Deltaproteobacteria bacterium]